MRFVEGHRKTQAKRREIETALTQLARKLVGRHVRVEFSDKVHLRKEELTGYGREYARLRTAGGAYYPAERIIKIALRDRNYRNPEVSLYHESFHVLQDMLATRKEIAILRREDARLRSLIELHWRATPQEVASLSPSEVQAHAFDVWRVHKNVGLPSGIEGLFNRMRGFLRRVRNALSGLGFKTSEDIFETLHSGGMAGREAEPIGRFELEQIGVRTGFAMIYREGPRPQQPRRCARPMIGATALFAVALAIFPMQDLGATEFTCAGALTTGYIANDAYLQRHSSPTYLWACDEPISWHDQLFGKRSHPSPRRPLRDIEIGLERGYLSPWLGLGPSRNKRERTINEIKRDIHDPFRGIHTKRI